MKYLSPQYMMTFIEDYCEGTLCHKNCEVFELCNKNFNPDAEKEEAFLLLTLNDLEVVK